jgi:hypothetical protein
MQPPELPDPSEDEDGVTERRFAELLRRFWNPREQHDGDAE